MRKRLLLLLPLLAWAVSALPSARATTAPGPRVLVYGDSLTAEATPYLQLVFRDIAGVEGVVRGMPGGATCDALPAMRADIARYRPTIVVIAFGGNAFTECMADEHGEPLPRPAVIAKYRADTVEAIRILRPGSPAIWLATSPIALIPEKTDDKEAEAFASMWHGLARENPRVKVTDAAAAVLHRGYWTKTLPCLPKEPCEGGVNAQFQRVNFVRSTDSGHFCPGPSTLGGDCATHSSGALRFAVGLLKPALESQRLWDAAKAERTIVAGWPGEAGR